MKIAVVDDNEADVELFLKLIEEYAQMHHKTIYTVVFSKGEELLNKFKKEKFSAIFLDIYMEGYKRSGSRKKNQKKGYRCAFDFHNNKRGVFCRRF